MCCYILGINDRHLENFLIDKTDGSLVAIDFGYAFGTSTRINFKKYIYISKKWVSIRLTLFVVPFL